MYIGTYVGNLLYTFKDKFDGKLIPLDKFKNLPNTRYTCFYFHENTLFVGKDR